MVWTGDSPLQATMRFQRSVSCRKRSSRCVAKAGLTVALRFLVFVSFAKRHLGSVVRFHDAPLGTGLRAKTYEKYEKVHIVPRPVVWVGHACFPVVWVGHACFPHDSCLSMHHWLIQEPPSAELGRLGKGTVISGETCAARPCETAPSTDLGRQFQRAA